jgi:hypothetical protein
MSRSGKASRENQQTAEHLSGSRLVGVPSSNGFEDEAEAGFGA